MAIELGANLLGEVIIFVIGAGVLLIEYQRQNRKEAMKEEMAIQEKAELQAMLNELAFQAERQDTQIRELTRILADLGRFSILKVLQCQILKFPHFRFKVMDTKDSQRHCGSQKNPGRVQR